MKKNILLVQSLALLPLLAATPLFSMNHVNYKEKQEVQTSQGKNRKQRRQEEKAHKKGFTYQQKQQITENNQEPTAQTEEKTPVIQASHQQVMNELIASTIFQRQRTQNDTIQLFDEIIAELSNTPTPEAQTATSNLIQSENEIINISSPAPVIHNNTPEVLPNPLWASVILPVDEKDLSLLEWATYKLSSAKYILQQVISDLKTGAFDVRYKTSFDRLEEAIETAISNDDVQSLVEIAALCQQKYKISIRIADKVAKPASELLSTHYSKELTLANNTLQQKLEARTKEWNLETVACMTSIINAVTIYQENMKKMHENYKTALEQETKRITDLRREVSTFSCLNPSIRPTTADLLKNNQLAIPKNDVHSSIMSVSEKKLGEVMGSVQDIATIKGLQIKPQYAAELDQKCLTNK